MVGRITAPLGFVNKPKLIREGRAASCILRPPSAKELQAQGTRPAAQTPSNTHEPNPEKQEPPGSPSERDRDSQQQWCDDNKTALHTHTHTRVALIYKNVIEIGMEAEKIQTQSNLLNILFWGSCFIGDSIFQTFSKHVAMATYCLPHSGGTFTYNPNSKCHVNKNRMQFGNLKPICYSQ